MRRDQLHSLPHLSDFRTQHRQHPTAAEAALWVDLKGHHLKGKEFRRQHSIENYIVDFYCASAKLIVEVDGEMHDEMIAYQNDQVRDERLRQLGFKVLRFKNEDIANNIDAVLKTISQSLF